MATPLPRDVNGWTIFTPSEPKQDGYNGGAGPAGSLLIHVDDTNGFDTEGTGASQGNGSMAHPYKTIAKGLSRIRNNSPDWLRLRMGTQYTNQLYDTVHMHGRSPSEPMVFGAWHPSVPYDANPGAAYGAQPKIPLPRTANIFGLNGYSVSSGVADLSNFYLTGIEFYLPWNDPTSIDFGGLAQTVTFNTSTNVVTFPAGTSQTNSIVNEQLVYFFGTLPQPLVDAGAALSAWYYLIPVSGNQFTIQTVRAFTTQPECAVYSTDLAYVSFNSGLDGGGGNGGYTRDPGIAPGMSVTGTGIPGGATVTVVHSTEYLSCTTVAGNTTVTSDMPVPSTLVGQYVKMFSIGGFQGARVTSVPNSSHFVVNSAPTANASGNVFFLDGVTLSANATTGVNRVLSFTPSAASAVDLTTVGSGTFTARLPNIANAGGVFYGGNNPGQVQPTDFYTEDCYFNCTNIGMEIEFAGAVGFSIRRSRFYNCAGFHIHCWGGQGNFEENLLDVGGWLYGYPFGTYRKGASQLLHNLYFSGEPHTDTSNTDCTQICKPFRGNIFAQDTADSQVRPGGDWIDNLCMSWGQHNWGTLIPGSQNNISYNVYTNGLGDENGGGWDQMASYDTGSDNSSYLRGNTMSEENIYTYVGNGYNGQGHCGTSAAIGWDSLLDAVSLGNFTIKNHIAWGFDNIQDMLNAAHPGKTTYQGFIIQEPARHGVTGRNADATYGFPDPNRTVATYMDETFGGSGHTFLDLLVAARGQRKGNWDYRLTANAVNNYHRAGFNRPAYIWGTTPPPVQQYHRVTLTMTAA